MAFRASVNKVTPSSSCERARSSDERVVRERRSVFITEGPKMKNTAYAATILGISFLICVFTVSVIEAKVWDRQAKQQLVEKIVRYRGLCCLKRVAHGIHHQRHTKTDVAGTARRDVGVATRCKAGGRSVEPSAAPDHALGTGV